MQNQNLNKFKLEITEEKSNFFHVGQLTIPKEIIKIYKGKFWDLVAKNTVIPGFRPNKAPIEQVKKYRGQDFFDENFKGFFQEECFDIIFGNIRQYPTTIGNSYLYSQITNLIEKDDGEWIIPFFLNMSGKIETRYINLKMPIVQKSEIESRCGAKEKLWNRWSMDFFGDNNKYVSSKEPIKLGDKVLTKAKIYFKDKPERVIAEYPLGYTVVGINGFIPEIDQGLLGKKATSRTGKIHFTYAKNSPSIYAGMEATYEFKIHHVLSPELETVEAIFANAKGKTVGGYKDYKDLQNEFEEFYKDKYENKTNEVIQDDICKQLVAQIPDFALDDKVAVDRKNEVAKQSKDFKDLGQIISFVDSEFGKFEGDPNMNYIDQTYKVNYDILKTENILSHLFIKYSEQIKLLSEDDYFSDEELAEQIEQEAEETDELQNTIIMKQLQLGQKQMHQNRHKALDFITNTFIKKGKFVG
jgi:hypothetical protein